MGHDYLTGVEVAVARGLLMCSMTQSGEKSRN